MKGFANAVRNINRLREVVQVLFKYQFRDIVWNTALRQYLPSRPLPVRPETEAPLADPERWQRLRKVVEELGPTFIKLAQLLSNRPDLIPAPLIAEFAKLQSEVPPLDFAIMEQRIEKELGGPVSNFFSYIDKQALGSASIGQVHRARLMTGEDVVIKVQRPGVGRQIQTDLALLKDLVGLTEGYFRSIGILNPRAILEAFEESMQRELDYTRELRNMELFRNIYQEEPNFYIPKPYKQFSSTKLLVTEFISGCKITDVAQLEAWGQDSRKVAERGLNIYLKQIFEYGFFHADPHPGNILIRPNGTMVLIDFGMVGRLSKVNKYAFAGVMIGLANQDAKAMALHLRRLASESDIESLGHFEQDLSELIEDFMVFAPGENGMSQLTHRLQKIIHKYQLEIPGPVFLILRALAILEGVGRVLHPKFDTLRQVRPYGLKLLAEQFSFRNQRQELGYTLSQLVSLLYLFPVELKYILKKMREGELRLHWTLQGYDVFLEKLTALPTGWYSLCSLGPCSLPRP
ncbi:MAG: AarF/ABC1/UbiB kinase family protein [Microscillaceae bacterium]|nr:AarF/ABC1/UbiB kinase family protein [Microscillaceae bacterium]